MKFINLTIFLCVVFSSCGKVNRTASDIVPAYKLIVTFSERIKTKTDLILYCYGINQDLPKDYQYKNVVANFSADYKLYKTQKDTVSLEHARELIVSLAESLLEEINSNQNVRPDLEVHPFTTDLLAVSIRFEDENQIDLGQGVSGVYFRKGKIQYDRYDISEYTGRYPAIGKHFTIHQETYAEALDIVQKQGALAHF